MPKWHSGPGLQRPKKPGKTGQTAEEIACRIGKLRGRDYRRSYNAITSGKYDNPTAVPSVRSNLTSILGRTAAYRGREVTWSDMITVCETLKPDLTGLKS